MSPETRRKALRGLLGQLPEWQRPFSILSRTITEAAEYVVEHLLLDLNGIEMVPAVFVRPKGSGPFPAILYNHAHGNNYAVGKTELLQGGRSFQDPPYAIELTRRGIAALCIDQYCFEGRNGRSESATFKEMLWRGQVLWGMMVYDNLRALDYLLSRPDVENGRVGTLGLSMGSTMAWWCAALDPQLKLCIDICCLTDFHALIESAGLDRHGIYYYVPHLLTQFTTADIVALIAPRPYLSVAGTRDPLTPVAGLNRIDAAQQAVYAAHGVPEAWRLVREPVGHEETAVMRAEILTFLDTWL